MFAMHIAISGVDVLWDMHSSIPTIFTPYLRVVYLTSAAILLRGAVWQVDFNVGWRDDWDFCSLYIITQQRGAGNRQVRMRLREGTALERGYTENGSVSTLLFNIWFLCCLFSCQLTLSLFSIFFFLEKLKGMHVVHWSGYIISLHLLSRSILSLLCTWKFGGNLQKISTMRWMKSTKVCILHVNKES